MMYSTPKTIEREKRAGESRKSKEIINKLSMDRDIKDNIDTFIEGYNHELDTYFKILDEVSESKEELQQKKKEDLITDTMLEKEEKELDAKIELLRDRAVKNLEALSIKIKEIYKEKAKISGANINDDDVKLLKSGIKLTYEELMEMVNRYNATNNQTMLRIIKGYAEDNGISIVVNQADDSLNAIDQLMNFTKQGITRESEYWAMSIRPEHRSFLINNLKKSLGQELE